MSDNTSPATEKRPWPTIKTSKISKSPSTSNLTGTNSTDTANLVLSTEKKRNKLGYHRTSVACGHCRRRKIRCIPAPGDKRCSNCIRLKKECNFYPVDQQSSAVLIHRDSKTQGTSERHSRKGSLPSMNMNSQMSDLASSSLPYSSHLSMPPIQNLVCSQTKNQRAESFSPGITHKVIRSEHDFGFNNVAGSSSNWINPDSLPVPESSQEVSSYWITHPQESSLPPGYSFTPSLQVSPLQNWTTGHADLNSLEDITWSAPPRTISFDNLPSSNNHHQYDPHNDNPSSLPAEHQVIKRGDGSSMSICPPLITNNVIGPNITSTDERSRQAQMANTQNIPIQDWQQSHHHQRHSSSRSLDHFGSWNQAQNDSHRWEGRLHFQQPRKSSMTITDNECFKREFYYIGSLFAAQGFTILLMGLFRRHENNKQLFSRREDGTLVEDPSMRWFRTSGNVFLILSGASLIAYTGLIVLIVQMID